MTVFGWNLFQSAERDTMTLRDTMIGPAVVGRARYAGSSPEGPAVACRDRAVAKVRGRPVNFGLSGPGALPRVTKPYGTG